MSAPTVSDLALSAPTGSGPAGTRRPFDRVLVANRGEIAVRIIRTLRRLGIHAIAVYSDADAEAPHVTLADTAVRIGPAPAAQSYLDPARIVAAALETGAQAVHPGYGFLSEHAGFAAACADAGLVFIGPGIRALEVMGDKIRAKRHVEASGVPVVPGVADPSLDDDALVAAADGVGYPVLVKPSAGGGGKGMQVAGDARELATALPAARRVAKAAFGDDTLLIERFIERPRHIEVQVLADAHGTVVHLGERECSLQRRHQKVIEEAPSPLLDEATRERIGAAACRAAESVGYLGAGTVEFLVSDASPGEFFFIEMNTRLQVEHPVTELVTGVDLVEQQLHVAAGEPLPFSQDAISLTGHAVEARLYAESPERGFLPATGDVLVWESPSGDGIRVDAALRAGQAVTAHYDPMLGKIIAWAPTRAEALDRLDTALAETVVLGVDTNATFLRRLLADPAVRRGDLHTGLIDALTETEPTGHSDGPDDALLVAAATALADGAVPTPGARAWQRELRWRAGGGRPFRVQLEPVAGPFTGTVLAEASGSRGASAGAEASAIAPDGTVWVHAAGATAAFRRVDRAEALRARLAGVERGSAADPEHRAPMPGTVSAVFVDDGADVEPGTPLVAVEAMKMEHRVLASLAGVVRIAVAVGEQVSRDQPIARVVPRDAPAAGVA
ncbi:acetyl/propionyl/methylcrotonyl-CoA carboxylase subunit alpha [Agromyces aerolatus]|uniref:acetyl/propionyl/methylcrotonyl-CoA carboxylase subunit alpha n=1 Tax=Agromyces sp. LY-1074 TaxID=3074080 RepID=UPI0028677521|nr:MULTISPECIES: biotin carboxylase N-terminal domain-containing protein [unclassified Agromyces]MDR5701045.1 biotin carboxylase N-terminal domain-containing protein [Agromyces sp. LY-1074]MDR5707685.1 biotin carboxylase N-terminal domain-containing protein [Agromyces sp. LY-1358]